jgi:rubrerythrin
MNNREIEAGMGFSNNNTVRWYKHKIKSKYLQMKYNTTNEWICKECAYQWRSPERQNCPQCNNKSILKTKKNIPNIPEDI